VSWEGGLLAGLVRRGEMGRGVGFCAVCGGGGEGLRVGWG